MKSLAALLSTKQSHRGSRPALCVRGPARVNKQGYEACRPEDPPASKVCSDLGPNLWHPLLGLPTLYLQKEQGGMRCAYFLRAEQGVCGQAIPGQHVPTHDAEVIDKEVATYFIAASFAKQFNVSLRANWKKDCRVEFVQCFRH